MTLRISRSIQDKTVVFVLCGRMETEYVEELKRLFALEPRDTKIVADLREVTLVNEKGIKFLTSCEERGLTLMNCPAYISEWMGRLRDEEARTAREIN